MKQNINFTDAGSLFTRCDTSKIAILPVPYDKTSTWIKGAHKGPFAILEASQALELYDIETDFEVYKKGIHTYPALSVEKLAPEKMAVKVEKEILRLSEKEKFVVMLGGEHSVSVGAVKAYAKKFKGLSVLQLDAHSDLRDEYEGSAYNHACVMARVKETVSRCVQVGVRSMDICEKNSFRAEDMFFAHDIAGRIDWMDRAIARLTGDVYVTIDLDVFDSSLMPSTGTPAPGGFDWYAVTSFLKKVSGKKNIVGFDVVELCPNKNNKAPDFLAANLVYKFLSYIFKK